MRERASAKEGCGRAHDPHYVPWRGWKGEARQRAADSSVVTSSEGTGPRLAACDGGGGGMARRCQLARAAPAQCPLAS